MRLHANRAEYPLLNLRLFKVRTFRVSVLGGLITRLGIGGLPFLLPLFYQLGMGMPAWQSGLMMMPSAIAAMTVKALSPHLLSPLRLSTHSDREHYFDRAWSSDCSRWRIRTRRSSSIVLLSFLVGSGNSMQFSSMNSLAFADIDARNSSMANTIVPAPRSSCR